MPDMAEVLRLLPNYQARKLPGRHFMQRAGVACVLRQAEATDSSTGPGQVEVMLIKRATREGDPWSGDMAFPGGKMESRDAHIYETTLREVAEEIGLERGQLRDLGRLSEQMTKTHSGLKPMAITPFLFTTVGEPEFVLNYEVAEIVWMPLDFFIDQGNRAEMTWSLSGFKKQMPCYYFHEYRVWGLTLRMLDELCQIFRSIDSDTRC